MMHLRKANVRDFPMYKELFEDEEFKYQWMYYFPLTNATSEAAEETNLEDLSDVIENYHNYSLERFKRDLEVQYIFMIEDETEILGYIQLFYCGAGVYKLAEWAMFQNNESVKREVIENVKALKLPRLREIHVSLIHEPAIDFFLKNGFVDKGYYFFKWEASGKKSS